MSTQRHHSFSSLIGLLVIGLAISVVALPAVAKTSAPAKGPKTTKAPKPPKLAKAAKLEIETLKKLIDHHARMINRMQLVDSLTTNTEALAFAHVFVAREIDEMTTMTSWLASWYQITYSPRGFHVTPPATALNDARAFEILASAVGYDHSEIAFCNQLVRNKGFHPEVRDLAKQMIITDRAELIQLKALLTALANPDDDDDDAETPDD